MDNWLPIVGGIVLIVVFLFPFLPIGTRPRCPECGGRQLGKQSMSTSMRANDFSGGGGGGNSVQMRYEVKYTCNDCQAQWTTTETETR